MEKPISIILEELKQDIANSINNSQLPLAIIEPVMKDLYNEIVTLAQKQLIKDKENYKKSQEEDKE